MSNDLTTLPQEDEVPPPSPPEPIVLPQEKSRDDFNLVANRVSLEGSLDDPAAIAAVESVITNYKSDINTFLIARCRRSAKRFESYNLFLDKVETELMQDHRISGASTSELIRLMQSVSSRMQQDLDLMLTMADKIGVKVTVRNDNRMVVAGNLIRGLANVDLSDRQSREKIRGFFARVGSKMGELEVQSETEALEVVAVKTNGTSPG